MRLEPLIGLPEAARILCVSRRTLRRWLSEELGIIFPQGKRGVRRLVRVRDLEILVRIHAGTPDWTLARGGSREMETVFRSLSKDTTAAAREGAEVHGSIPKELSPSALSWNEEK